MLTWHAMAALQAARECCGGSGYGSFSKIGIVKNELDVWLTFEGDNFVLLQQMSRHLLQVSLLFSACCVPLADGAVQAFSKQQMDGRFHSDLDFMNAADAPLPGGDASDVRAFNMQQAFFALRYAAPVHPLSSDRVCFDRLARQPFCARPAWSLRRRWAVRRRPSRRGTKSPISLPSSVRALLSLVFLLIAVPAAKAHTERVALEWFEAAAVRAASSVRPILTRLRSLYALWRCAEDASFLREVPAVVTHSSAIRTAVRTAGNHLAF